MYPSMYPAPNSYAHFPVIARRDVECRVIQKSDDVRMGEALDSFELVRKPPMTLGVEYKLEGTWLLVFARKVFDDENWAWPP